MLPPASPGPRAVEPGDQPAGLAALWSGQVPAAVSISFFEPEAWPERSRILEMGGRPKPTTRRHNHHGELLATRSNVGQVEQLAGLHRVRSVEAFSAPALQRPSRPPDGRPGVMESTGLDLGQERSSVWRTRADTGDTADPPRFRGRDCSAAELACRPGLVEHGRNPGGTTGGDATQGMARVTGSVCGDSGRAGGAGGRRLTGLRPRPG
jgi:hypothetical protein